MVINSNMSNNLTIILKKENKSKDTKEILNNDESIEIKEKKPLDLNIDFSEETKNFSKENVLSKNGSLIESQGNISQNNIKDLLN